MSLVIIIVNYAIPIIIESLNFHFKPEIMSDPNSKLNLSLKCYDFCIDAQEQLSDHPSNMRVASPDFPILLDHTIGVIWKLLNKDADAGSVDHYHFIWALKFLEGIKPRNGHVTKDVEMLKLMMRRLLVEEYAGSDVAKPKPTQPKPGPNNEQSGLDGTEISFSDDGDLNRGFDAGKVSQLFNLNKFSLNYTNKLFSGPKR